MDDLTMLYILTVLLFLAAFMKLILAQKKKEQLTVGWKVQRFIFPVLMLVVLILFQTGIKDWVIQGIFIGIIEELICWGIRKRSAKNPQGTGEKQ